MKTTTLLCLILTLFFTRAFAQPPSIEWENDFGADLDDTGYGIQQTDDGGYIVTGSTKSEQNNDHSEPSCGDYDIWVLKLDGLGNLSSQQSIRALESDRSECIVQVNGGYIVQGHSKSSNTCDKTSTNTSGYDAWFVKLDESLLNIVWQNSFGGSGYDNFPSSAIRKTDNLGGTIACGYTTTNGDRDYYIKKLNSSGNADWTLIAGGDKDDECNDIIQTSDGGYMAIGYSRSGISGDKTVDCNECDSANYWLLKLDDAGNIQAQYEYGGTGDDIGGSIIETSDGSFIIAGSSSSPISGTKSENKIGGTDYWVLKIDASGNVLDQNTIGGFGDDEFNLMVGGINGGYLLAGTSNSENAGDKTGISRGGYDYWVVKVNGTLDVVWDKTMGSTSDEFLRGLDATSDGGYIINGRSDSPAGGEKGKNSHGGYDYWVVKLAPDVTGIDDVVNSQIYFSITPNPANSIVTLDFATMNHTIETIQIFNAVGKRIMLNEKINSGQLQFDVKSFPSGFYFVEVTTKDGIRVKKLVIQ